jgi:hypothetical protein
MYFVCFLQEVLIDPNSLIHDLYIAVTQNDTEKAMKFLEMKVPPTYHDNRAGLTVSIFRDSVLSTM